MLQQTQVERVIPFYNAFLTTFPTVQDLAKAPLADVLRAWQGLGYNRRAKMLHAAAKQAVEVWKGRFPKTAAALKTLPGVGPYTACAVAAFAYNADGIFIETNIRTAVTHHFFADKKNISDSDILPVLEEAFPKGKSREWYAALMDYGAHLKRSGVRINNKSKHYTKQSTFAGSAREVRGGILRALSEKPCKKSVLVQQFGAERALQVQEQLTKLEAEGFIVKRRADFFLAQ